MSRLVILISIASALAAGMPAHAQQPYTGLEARPIKALSEQQMADLRAGRGMGLALAAELNGYPGPMHVLELAEPLALSDQQRAKVQELFAAMKAEAVPLGETLIAQEADLDKQFGATQAALRGAHLKYHLLTLDVLTPAQGARYGELRGYHAGTQHGHGRH
jgi:hypothetical protein